MKQLLADLGAWMQALKKARAYTPRHHRRWFESKYKNPGATHYGDWYDQKTDLWPIVVAP